MSLSACLKWLSYFYDSGKEGKFSGSAQMLSSFPQLKSVCFCKQLLILKCSLSLYMMINDVVSPVIVFCRKVISFPIKWGEGKHKKLQDLWLKRKCRILSLWVIFPGKGVKHFLYTHLPSVQDRRSPLLFFIFLKIRE